MKTKKLPEWKHFVLQKFTIEIVNHVEDKQELEKKLTDCLLELQKTDNGGWYWLEKGGIKIPPTVSECVFWLMSPKGRNRKSFVHLKIK